MKNIDMKFAQEKILMKKCVSKFFTDKHISKDFEGVIEDRVFSEFQLKNNVIMDGYTGKVQYSTYCVAVFVRMIREAVLLENRVPKQLERAV